MSFDFSLNFCVFQMHETQLKSFVFEMLFIGDYSSSFYLFNLPEIIVRHFISLMEKFEVYNVFSF